MAEMLEMFPNTKYIPVPINREVCPYREVKQAKTFVHVAGVKLYEDRNGTEIVFKAIPLVQADVKFIIYTQHEIEPELMALVQDDPRVEVRSENLSYGECWAEGDVSILPRRYGGLSLQLNEAMSSGMIPICTDIEPQNTFLHHMSLIATCGSKKVMTRGTEIDCYDVDPADLAAKIDELAILPEESIIELSKFYNDLAESISWEKMTPVYLNLLASL